ILYRVVPAFYEEIAQALEKHYAVPAESIELPPILRFGSWVGGDMDGNPDVHAKTIRETLARQQQVILNTYLGLPQGRGAALAERRAHRGVRGAGAAGGGLHDARAERAQRDPRPARPHAVPGVSRPDRRAPPPDLRRARQRLRERASVPR